MINERQPCQTRRFDADGSFIRDSDLSALLRRVREDNIALRNLCFALDSDTANSVYTSRRSTDPR